VLLQHLEETIEESRASFTCRKETEDQKENPAVLAQDIKRHLLREQSNSFHDCIRRYPYQSSLRQNRKY
jgi:hypothetical protein